MKFCPTCRRPLQYENAEICPSCGVRIQPPPQIKTEDRTTENRNPWVALILSFLFPGWGQWYNGKTWDGLKFLGAIFVIYALAFVLLLTGVNSTSSILLILSIISYIVLFGIWIYGMYDAYTTAERINKREESFSGKSGLFWLPLVLLVLYIFLAVSSYVVLGSGFFNTQKEREAVYKGSEQSTADVQRIGGVYGFASNPYVGIDEIRFTIGLTPGAPPIDLTKMKIVFSAPTKSPKILTQGATASTSVFTTKLDGAGNIVNSMNPYEQVEISFKIDPVMANTRMYIELEPAVGASLPFSKTVPPTIAAVNVLY